MLRSAKRRSKEHPEKQKQRDSYQRKQTVYRVMLVSEEVSCQEVRSKE
jgi:hypothetical protein